MRSRFMLSLALGAVLAMGSLAHAQPSLQKSLKDTAIGAHWIYNDLEAGFAQAKSTGKPLAVLFRCVP